MTVRIAIIGAGIMGSDHAKIVSQDLPGAKLQLVCDVDIAKARAVADVCSAQDVSSDPESIIARDDVDAVIVASPDRTHAPLSLACLKYKKPVLCEKPLSQSSAECLDVVNAEMKTGRRWIQLGFMRRYDQSYKEMKTALTSGMLGRALMMHNFHRNVETPASDFTGAMAITNSAPHEFDVARYVLNTEFVAVSAFQPKRSDDLVAPVMMVLETSEGQLVTIEINNNAAYGYDVRGELVGEQGSIALNTPCYTRLDVGMRQSTDYASDWRPCYLDAYRQQNKAFLTFVQTGEFPEIGADSWDGYCAAVVSEAGVQALNSGAKVSIDRVEKPSFTAMNRQASQ